MARTSVTRRKNQTGFAVSVVVPCFNEEEGIAEFHRRLAAALCALPGSGEIIYVNDGSADQTLQALNRLPDEGLCLRVVNLSRNFGHQMAASAGLALARGQRVLIIDADLQDPPELLPDMMRLMDEGADVVYGQRVSRRGESRFKLASAALFYRMLRRLSGVDIPRDAGDFRLITRQIADILNAMPEQHRFLRGMVAMVGFRQVALPYERDARHAGVTHYPLGRMLGLAIDGITGFATAPLRAFFQLSAIVGLMAVALAGWTLYSYFAFSTTPGWPSLMSTVLFFSAIQIFGIALIGEYVGRTFIQTKSRPLYLVQSIQENGKPIKPNRSGRKGSHASGR
ncbi:MAG: glycosyltransferase family 2 protein [Alphaproteobacteria bacterium]|nr:glycosyltransferase family 2 protein [Alphaproteobacteria bacterium]